MAELQALGDSQPKPVYLPPQRTVCAQQTEQLGPEPVSAGVRRLQAQETAGQPLGLCLYPLVCCVALHAPSARRPAWVDRRQAGADPALRELP